MKINSNLLRTVTVIFCILALAGSFAACSLPKSSVTTTLTLQSEGTVTEEIVEDVADADFTEDELRAYIEDAVAGFDASENPSVTLESCTVSGKSVEIVMHYASVDDYSRFNNVPCFLGTIAQAREAGFDMDQVFLDPSGAEGEKTEIESREKEWKVFICSEPIYLKMPDKILYATDNVSITGRLTAEVNSVADKKETALPEGTESVLSGSGSTGTVPSADTAGSGEKEPHPYSTVAHRFAYIIYK